MPDYQIKISAVDNATPVVDNAFKKTGKTANDVSGKIANRFRDVFENVTQNATGTFGSVAGGLFKLPGIAGIAAAGVLAAFGAMIASAKKYAEATAGTNESSAQFLATLENLKSGFGDVVNSVGSSVIPIFNSLAEAFGFAGTKADELEAKRKALFTGLKSQREEINTLVENLTLQRESQGAFKPVIDAANALNKLKSQQADINNQIAETEKKITDARENAYKDQGLAYLLDKNTRDLANEKLATQNLSLSPLREQLENLNAQVLAAEELLLKEKALFDARNKKPENDDSLKLELESAKRLGESILSTFKAIDEAQRNSIKEGIARMDDALEKNRKDFNDEIERQKKVLEVGAELRRKQDEAFERQQEAARQVGEAIKSSIVSSFESAILSARNLNDVINSILKSFLRIGLNLFLNALTGGAGARGFLGSVFNPSSSRILPSSVATPVSALSRPILQRVASAVPTSGGVTVNLNITTAQIDDSYVRYKLMPAINREVRRGTRLMANVQQ